MQGLSLLTSVFCDLPKGNKLMKKRVVVVEDDIQTAELVRIILEQAGYEVVNHYHGVDAMNYLKKESVDLVLLDIRLPGYDGFEILYWLRSESHQKTTPVIMLSADVMSNSQQWAEDLGANDYVCKPFQLDDFINRINAAIETAVIPWPTFSPSWHYAAAH